MTDETLFESESRLTRAELAAYFHGLSDDLDLGADVWLASGEEAVSVDPPRIVGFDVTVERETPPDGPREGSLELELTWDVKDGGASTENE